MSNKSLSTIAECDEVSHTFSDSDVNSIITDYGSCSTDNYIQIINPVLQQNGTVEVLQLEPAILRLTKLNRFVNLTNVTKLNTSLYECSECCSNPNVPFNGTLDSKAKFNRATDYRNNNCHPNNLKCKYDHVYSVDDCMYCEQRKTCQHLGDHCLSNRDQCNDCVLSNGFNSEMQLDSMKPVLEIVCLIEEKLKSLLVKIRNIEKQSVRFLGQYTSETLTTLHKELKSIRAFLIQLHSSNSVIINIVLGILSEKKRKLKLLRDTTFDNILVKPNQNSISI
ncbi:hypothetical protein GJ496_000653 [Pomphorhynchus laevis]|nr:hypothetical protein GJ496_000653 [Pomphorhynchus laevis]